MTLTKQTNKKKQNKNRQTYYILEGFKQNGLQIRIQRIFLHRIAYVKNDFRHFLKNVKCRPLKH